MMFRRPPFALFTALLATIVASTFPGSALADVNSDAIEDAVATRIAADAYVPDEDVTAKVEGQQVTLRGWVPNMLVKTRAERIAETVPGVVEVHNQIRIRAAEQRDDDELQEAVLDLFRNDPYLNRYDLDFSVRDGVGTVVGNVPRRVYQDAAVDLAAQVDGLSDVRDDIQVRTDVETREGRLAEPKQTRQPKTTDNRDTPGADDLFRRPGAAANGQPRQPSGDEPSMSDRQANASAPLAERARQAAESDARINAGGLEFSDDGGVVRVSGTLPVLAHKRVLMENLARVQGVRDVDLSEIEIDPEIEQATRSPQSDRQIRDNVMSRLQSSPRLDASDISVDVSDRVVELTGQVDSPAERRRAIAETRVVPGVRDVSQSLSTRRGTPAKRAPTSASKQTSDRQRRTTRSTSRSDDGGLTPNARENEQADEDYGSTTAGRTGGTERPDGSLDVTVKSPSNDRERQAASRPDKEIETQLNETLDQVQPGVRATVAKQTVNLTGEVASRAEAERLVRQIEEVRGVDSVVDNIKVDAPNRYIGDPYVDGIGTFDFLKDEEGLMDELDGGGFGIGRSRYGAITSKELRMALEDDTPGGISIAAPGNAPQADRKEAITGASEGGIGTRGVQADGNPEFETPDPERREIGETVPEEVADDLGPTDPIDTDDQEMLRDRAREMRRQRVRRNPNADLVEKVKAALADNRYLNDAEVDVEANVAGEVILTGAVSNYIEYAAVRRAAFEAGATDIEMHVTVD